MKDRIIDPDRLRLLREQAGLRRRHLATLIGCSESHLTHVELGYGPPGKPIQLSGPFVFSAARELSKAHGREVGIDEFTTERQAS